MNRRELLALGGLVVAWPLAAHAQQTVIPVIGLLSSRSPIESQSLVDEFRAGLGEAGYVEGKNLAIEYRWPESGHYEQLPPLAADLVSRKVELIAALGGFPAAIAAKRATTTIPIVFIGGGDPVEAGLVSSLARPGGNITGISFLNADLHPKRFELLHQLVPQAKVIALLVNPDFPQTTRVIREVEAAASGKGVQLPILKATSEGEIEAAFAALAQLRATGLLVGADPFFASRQEQLVALAARYEVPAIYQWREFTAAGGLISYGTRLPAVFRQAGTYAGKILKGAKPADLPVEQPTKFELVINLKTANALGLTVPQTLFARADEVIE